MVLRRLVEVWGTMIDNYKSWFSVDDPRGVSRNAGSCSVGELIGQPLLINTYSKQYSLPEGHVK